MKYPKNKEHFKKLVKYSKKIIGLCEDLGMKPIIYGSLAVFHYTQNENLEVNDIDLLINHKDYEKVIPALQKKKIPFNFYSEHDTLVIKEKGMKVELDSWGNKTNKEKTIKYDNYGLDIRMLSLKKLKEVYKYASKVSKENPEGNKLKYEMLKRVR